MVNSRRRGRTVIVLAAVMAVAVACGPGGSTGSAGSPAPSGSGGTGSPGATASTVAPRDELSHPPESPIATLPPSLGYD